MEFFFHIDFSDFCFFKINIPKLVNYSYLVFLLGFPSPNPTYKAPTPHRRVGKKKKVKEKKKKEEEAKN